MNEFNTNELYHHGILGQKWGVRRYQNKDGSLTAAGLRREQREQTKEKISKIKADAKAEAKKISAQGKIDARIAKAYAKAQAKKDKETEKANALINKNIEKVKNKSSANQAKEQEKEQEKKEKESNSKSIKDMSNEEIQAKINRIRLEKQLEELTPEKKGRIRSFISKFRDEAVEPAVVEGSKRAFTNLTQAWLQDKFGIDINKDGKLVGFKKDKISNNNNEDNDSGSNNKNKNQNKNDKTDDSSNTKNSETSSNSNKSNNDGSDKSGSNNNNSSKNSNQNKTSESNPFTKDNAIGVATVVGKELAPEIKSIANTVKDAYKKSMSTNTAYDLVKESANKPVSALINRNEASSAIYDDNMNSIRSEHASTRLSVNNYEATSNYKSSVNLNQFMNDNSGLSVKELMQRNNYNKYYDKTVKHSYEDEDDVLNGEQE